MKNLIMVMGLLLSGLVYSDDNIESPERLRMHQELDLAISSALFLHYSMLPNSITDLLTQKTKENSYNPEIANRLDMIEGLKDGALASAGLYFAFVWLSEVHDPRLINSLANSRLFGGWYRQIIYDGYLMRNYYRLALIHNNTNKSWTTGYIQRKSGQLTVQLSRFARDKILYSVGSSAVSAFVYGSARIENADIYASESIINEKRAVMQDEAEKLASYFSQLLSLEAKTERKLTKTFLEYIEKSIITYLKDGEEISYPLGNILSQAGVEDRTIQNYLLMTDLLEKNLKAIDFENEVLSIEDKFIVLRNLDSDLLKVSADMLFEKKYEHLQRRLNNLELINDILDFD
jgi:hypothetical protein